MTAVSKVTLNGQTLMDATTATASANEIISPYTAMTADGVMTTGTSAGDGLAYKVIAGDVAEGDVDWSKVTALKSGVFWGNRNITTVNNPTVSSIGEKVFESCSKLTNAEITTTKQLEAYCHNLFAYCTNLQSVKINFIFSGNSDVDFGGNYMLNGCNNIHTLIFTQSNASHPEKTLKIKYAVFMGTPKLRTLVLKCPNLVVNNSGKSVGGITDNPTESTIYVPQALLSEYQTATNWSDIYATGVTFAPIEGSIYE